MREGPFYNLRTDKGLEPERMPAFIVPRGHSARHRTRRVGDARERHLSAVRTRRGAELFA